MFGTQLNLKSLALVCRSLGTLIESGVSLPKAIVTAAGPGVDHRTRQVMAEISLRVEQGEDIATAMRVHEGEFPRVMIELIDVAEQTGAMPEILTNLASHFEHRLRLRRDFVRAMAWPMFQLVAAILIIALMLFVIGEITQSQPGRETPDVLGLGLTGAKGAVIWLSCTFGSMAVAFVSYQVITRSLVGKEFFHSLILPIPVLGTCMRDFAIARFSWSFYLTQEAGIPITSSIATSFQATGNGAFIRQIPWVCAAIESGELLGRVLRDTRLFPEDFLQMVEVAETSGTVPETLHRMSPQFQDQARRSMQAMTAALGWGVWLLVAAFIIFLVFSILLWYVKMLNAYTTM